MAVLPDLQEINEKKLVRSTICVICNVREDHLTEMGPTLDDVARSLSRSMPIRGICVTAEQDRVEILRAEAARRHTTLIQVDPNSVSDDEIRRFPHIAFKDNVAIALAVAELSGVDRDTALEGMIAARPDPGTVAVQTYQAEQRRISFANIFAANDPASSLMNIDLPAELADRVVDLGGSLDFAALLDALVTDADAGATLIAVGNIHGQGEILLERLNELPTAPARTTSHPVSPIDRTTIARRLAQHHFQWLRRGHGQNLLEPISLPIRRPVSAAPPTPRPSRPGTAHRAHSPSF
jgi:hypothetical protein